MVIICILIIEIIIIEIINSKKIYNPVSSFDKKVISKQIIELSSKGKE